MYDDVEKYGLDMHSTMILEDFRLKRPVYEQIRSRVETILRESITSSGIYITALETRVKTEESLAGKLEIKGSKYADIMSITDLVGARIITFYSDEVDKIAALVDKVFEVDWKNSVDKRRMHNLDSFGYDSLHYICSIPKSLYSDPQYPEINEIRFEVQMRTALQHVWATIHHDTGYKSGVEIPYEYLRNLSRLAGLLELADEQFSLLRTNINDYRRKIQSLVKEGNFKDIPLDGDSFRSYLELRPFDSLVKKIAAINQAEIHETNLFHYLEIFKLLEFRTLDDLETFRKDNFDDAYQLAMFSLGNTDIDIISSAVALQDLLIVYLLKKDAGINGLTLLFDYIYGKSEYNRQRAQRVMDMGKQLSFMNK